MSRSASIVIGVALATTALALREPRWTWRVVVMYITVVIASIAIAWVLRDPSERGR